MDAKMKERLDTMERNFSNLEIKVLKLLAEVEALKASGSYDGVYTEGAPQIVKDYLFSAEGKK